jgi:hypothetical protein
MALGILLGFLMGVGASALFVLSRSGRIRVSWLAWILIVIAAFMAVAGIQNYLGLLEEQESGGATIMAGAFLLQFAVPAILAALLIWFQSKKKPADKKEAAASA